MESNKKPTYQDLEKLIIELKSENKLKQSENNFNMLLKASEDMITIHKPNGEYLYYNGPASDAITPEDIVGKMPNALFDENVANTLLNTFEKVKKTGESETIEVLFEWQGEKKWFSEYIYPLKNSDGEIIKIVKVCRNIHKRKIAEQEIKSQNQKLNELNNLLNQTQRLAQVGSWLFNLPNQKIEWSNETFLIWGLDPKNDPPEYDTLANLVHVDDLKLFNSSYNKAINLGTPYDIEFRICFPNDKQKTIRTICHPVLDEYGKVISLVGANQDVTSQKIFEKAQVKHQRLKAIGEMSSSIAHDFNNSLQQMIGNLDVVKLQNNFSDNTLERLNNIGSIISDVAERVSGLQKFGDTEHDDKNAKLIDFNTLIEESLSQSRPLWKDGMEKEGLKINVITDFEDIPKISCNHGELKLVIYNLIKNSVEAMPKGGELIIKTSTKAKFVHVTFTDTGIGMDEETKSKIFQPFYSTKGFKLGRGLGMSGVYSTLRKYNGDIIVKSSELAKGTSIEMVFPIVKQDEIKVVSKNEQKDKASFSVLWVDDDTIITENIGELVELMGHKCNIANSGKKALDYLNENTCDIVFTDIGMPEMNGWELVAAVRSNFGNKIKIVTVTGWSIDEKVKKEHTIDFVLQKPFTVETLEKLFLKI
jgi:PAS domain S-box-containing protein